ncbi:hypothetical protein [Staphylococcus pragensis]|nr:hypothetical protein [Staphylococcus pragensis]
MLSTNQIALYRKLNNEYIEKAKVRFEQLKLSYLTNDEEEIKEIEISDEALNSYNINEFDSMWSPYDNNLKLEQKLVIDYPSVLFGEDGITCENNVIGLAVHIYSKTSSFQKTVEIASFKKQEERLEIDFDYNFEASTIRGVVNLDFFFYLKEVNETLPYMANNKGMTLSYEDLNPIELVVDGIGSSFPISEFEDKEGPLWKIEKNWISPDEDMLDASNISIAFNIKHPLFAEIKKETRRINSSYMNHIIVQAMAMIIQEVIIIEEYSIEEEEDLISGTILSAVSYWVKTFNIDLSDIFSIQNSLMKNIENLNMEEEN